jgi:hypothetical protein
MGRGGGAQRHVWGGSELKKTGARSARARTRGQNPLVNNTDSFCGGTDCTIYKIVHFFFRKVHQKNVPSVHNKKVYRFQSDVYNRFNVDKPIC